MGRVGGRRRVSNTELQQEVWCCNNIVFGSDARCAGCVQASHADGRHSSNVMQSDPSKARECGGRVKLEMGRNVTRPSGMQASFACTATAGITWYVAWYLQMREGVEGDKGFRMSLKRDACDGRRRPKLCRREGLQRRKW